MGRIIPRQDGAIHTPHSQEDALRILRDNVAESSRLSLWIPPQPFAGRIDGDRFLIARISRGSSNSFGPILSGRIVSEPTGTALVYRAETSLEVLIFAGLFFCASLLALAIAIGLQVLPAIAITLTLAIATPAALHLGFWAELPTSLALLNKVMSGQGACPAPQGAMDKTLQDSASPQTKTGSPTITWFLLAMGIWLLLVLPLLGVAVLVLTVLLRDRIARRSL